MYRGSPLWRSETGVEVVDYDIVKKCSALKELDIGKIGADHQSEP